MNINFKNYPSLGYIFIGGHKIKNCLLPKLKLYITRLSAEQHSQEDAKIVFH